jgi:hypothetical protein
LIGRTVAFRAPPVESEAASPLYGMILPVFLGALAATVVLAFVTAWWFRQGDRQVRSTLARAALPSFPGMAIREGAENPGGFSERFP